MKKLWFGLLLGCFAWQASAADAANPAWLTDLNAAKAKAKTESKLVLVDFTGSDWCPWCVKLKKEVFTQTDFLQFAAKNLVLVEIDFPRTKPQPDPLKKTNRALAQQYKIEGYPTVVVLNSEGKEVGRLGYQPGGPQPFIAQLQKLKGS